MLNSTIFLTSYAGSAILYSNSAKRARQRGLMLHKQSIGVEQTCEVQIVIANNLKFP